MTARPDLTLGDIEPGIVFLWPYDLTRQLSLSGNVGLFALREDMDQRFLQTTNSLSLAYAITEGI